MDWEEVKDLKTLAKVQTVDEMIPAPAENQISKWNSARIWEEQYRIIETYLMMDATVEDACIAAWISVPAYYKHKEKNPDFARRMEIAREYPKVAARAAVMKRIRLGDARTALEYLKLRDKRYKDWHVEESNTDNKTKVEFTLVSTVSWADQSENDSQTPTKQNLPYDSSVNSWEEEKLTPWENEDSILEKLAS